MRFKFPSDGYTMIELLGVIAITLVITGGALASYRQFDDRQKVIAEGKQFVVELREVQKKAQSGEKPEACVTAGFTLDGWRIKKINDTDYSLIAMCNGAEEASSELPLELAQDVTFDPSWVNPLTFDVLDGSVTNPTTIIMNGGSYTYQVRISSVGGIDDLGLN